MADEPMNWVELPARNVLESRAVETDFHNKRNGGVGVYAFCMALGVTEFVVSFSENLLLNLLCLSSTSCYYVLIFD